MSNTNTEINQDGKTVLFIPEFRYEGLCEIIAKLNKKAKKLNLEPITIRKTGASEIRTFRSTTIFHTEEGCDSKSQSTKVNAIEVEVTGQSPTLAGWELAAVIEPVEDTGHNILSVVPTFKVEIPQCYRSASNHCDHCQKIRNRNETFVLFNADKNEFKQIGRQCIRDFLGNLDPHVLLVGKSIFEAFYEALGEAGDFEGSCAQRERYYSLEGVLALTIALTDKYGFTSTTKARELDGIASTKDRLGNVLDPSNHPDAQKYAKEIREASKAEHITKEVADIIEWGKNLSLEDKSDYVANLAACFLVDDLPWKRAGLVCSAPSAYKRHIGQVAERARENATKLNEFFGSVGDKIEVTLTLIRLTDIESQFGISTLCVFEDAEGRSFKWFASNSPFATDDIGKTFPIKASIKGQDEYKGRKQTGLTRAKINVPKTPQPKLNKDGWRVVDVNKTTGRIQFEKKSYDTITPTEITLIGETFRCGDFCGHGQTGNRRIYSIYEIDYKNKSEISACESQLVA